MSYDGSGIAPIYASARELPAEAKVQWCLALRRMAPASLHLPATVTVDVGCGTGRFASILRDAFGGHVVGLDPSAEMLRHRALESHEVAYVRARAEAVPLSSEVADVALLSMVFHHFPRPAIALRDIRRVLRRGGVMFIRSATQETVLQTKLFEYFPEARRVELDRMPARRELLSACSGIGFEGIGVETVWQEFASSHEEYVSKIALRGLSSMRMIPDAAFAGGLARLREHKADGPIFEPIDLFAFV